eukprot:PITA_29267
MALVGECVETKPCSFEEEVQQPIWVDAMVEDYDSIVHNTVWDVVLIPENKSVVSSHWLYEMKQVVDGSVKKHKARFVPMAFHGSRGLNMMIIFLLSQGGPCKRIRDERHRSHALIPWHGVWQKDGELFVSQGKYANEILKRFHIEKCKPMQTPLVGNWRQEVATSSEVVEATVYR